MNNTILNWNGTDYTEVYARQLQQNPLYYDPILKVWITYSYEYCKAILLNSDAHVPEPVIGDDSPLNGKARLLIRKMARINNSQVHAAARTAAMAMYQRVSAVAVDDVLEILLADINTKGGFDWVEAVATQLPVRLIAKGLGFDEQDSLFVIENIEPMARIMLPNKTDDDVKKINAVIDRFYELAEKYAVADVLGDAEEIELNTCNLIGLFIQSYDGGWGLLCNTLLSLWSQNKNSASTRNDNSWYKKLVNETLRLDPPVHNTRRVATKDILLGGKTIKAGETISIVLAAANLDPAVFKDPEKFDITRGNIEQHLTFGLGGHNCVARYLNINMAADACNFLMNRYQHIDILQKEFNYEPKLNVRLISRLMVSLS